MSFVKISDLTEKTTLAGTEEVLINDSGTSKKMTTQRFLDVQTACETAQTAAELAETNAETAETNAAASASAASSSASAASSSASAASSSASSASSSATAASNAQSAAETARDQTLTAFDNFDDRYLGTKASDPSLDNDGNALVAGSLYFNSTSGEMRVYDGSQWLAAYASLSGALLATNNLSDLNDAATARTNLGVAIGTNVQAYDANIVSDASYVHTDNNYTTTEKSKLAGIESGATADQTAQEIATAIDADATAESTLKSALGLGTAAYTASTAYATASQGTNADTAYGWGNHASAGYLTSYTETDPVVGAVTGLVKADGAGNISAAIAGTDYLASFTETDPVFSASDAAGISSTDITNWDTAYGWGNHASAGYLTSETYTGTVTSVAATAGTGISISGSPITSSGTLTITNTAPDQTVSLTQGGATTITGTYPNFTISSTDTNTTYSAGSGLTLATTTFSLSADHRQASNIDAYDGNTNDYTFYDASVGIRWYTATAEEMRLTDAGTLHVDGDVVAYSTTVSDERLKTDIKTINNALDMVNNMRGVTFTYKKDGKQSAGVVAQELEKVFPRAITETQLPLKADDDKEYKVVQYDQLHGVLIEAIKELTARIKVLENK